METTTAPEKQEPEEREPASAADRLRRALAPRPEPVAVVPIEELCEPPPLADLVDAAPGPDLAARVAGLDPQRVGGYDLIELIAAWARLATWVQAGTARALAEFARRRPDPVEPNRRGDPGAALVGFSKFACDEVSARLRISPAAAEEHLPRPRPGAPAARHPGRARAGRSTRPAPGRSSSTPRPCRRSTPPRSRNASWPGHRSRPRSSCAAPWPGP